MFKTYMRLLGFARPIKKYAIPYFFYSLFYALFNSLTFMLIIPILNTMFDANYSFEYVEKLPPVELNKEYLATLFNFTYSHIFQEYSTQNVLMLLAIVAICISLLSNLFRYLGAWTMENMRTRTLQRMRNEMFSRVMDMNVGYFSDQRKGDIISKITSDVGVVQFCITNTLQVSFREPFLIIGYIVMMVSISWELAIFSVLFLPVVALLIGSIVKKLRHPARTNQQRMGEMVSTLDESLSGIKVIKSYNATRLMHRLNVELCGHGDAYRAALHELCPGCEGFIREPFRCDYGLNISVGEGSFVNFDCVFLDLAPIRIGRHTLIGPKVQLLTALHPFDAAQRRAGLEAGRPITVGDDCWLGGGVIVCPGVEIGDRSVIGAGAVVTRDIPADSVAVGNPARVIRTLPRPGETE